MIASSAGKLRGNTERQLRAKHCGHQRLWQYPGGAQTWQEHAVACTLPGVQEKPVQTGMRLVREQAPPPSQPSGPPRDAWHPGPAPGSSVRGSRPIAPYIHVVFGGRRCPEPPPNCASLQTRPGKRGYHAGKGSLLGRQPRCLQNLNNGPCFFFKQQIKKKSV